MRACLCGGGHRPEGLENHLRRSGTSYAQRLSVRMPMAPKEPGKNVKLRPLCVKSLRARASLLVRRRAQAGRFGKPPRKLHSSSVVSHKVLLDHHSYHFFLKNLAAKNYRHPKSFFFFYTFHGRFLVWLNIYQKSFPCKISKNIQEVKISHWLF